MAPRLNHGASGNARSLIDAGKYDDTSSWSFSAEDGDKLLGPGGNDWAEYRKWHLGEDDGPSDQKATYSYPYGKGGKVYGQALRAIRSRAAQNGATEIFDEAGTLLDLLNKKTGAKNTILGAYYSMKASATEGEILLYSEIGGGGGFFADPGIGAEDFARDLKALGKVKTINCRINSPGGQVFEGMTIYNLLAAHPAQVVVHVDGLAASIASVIAMAGNKINIADNAMMMIHDAWGVGFGTADEIRKTADVLDSITSTIAATYAKRSKADPAKIRSMMAAETWMTAKEAKDCGLVDNVVDSMNVQASAFQPRWFKNAPAEVVERNAARPARDRFAARFQRLKVDTLKARRTASAA